MAYNDVVARSTSFERIRQPSLKEGAFSSMRWVIRRQIPTLYLYPRLIVCVANTREIVKKLRVNSTRLKQVVLAYSLPVVGLPDFRCIATVLI